MILDHLPLTHRLILEGFLSSSGSLEPYWNIRSIGVGPNPWELYYNYWGWLEDPFHHIFSTLVLSPLMYILNAKLKLPNIWSVNSMLYNKLLIIIIVPWYKLYELFNLASIVVHSINTIYTHIYSLTLFKINSKTKRLL